MKFIVRRFERKEEQWGEVGEIRNTETESIYSIASYSTGRHTVHVSISRMVCQAKMSMLKPDGTAPLAYSLDGYKFKVLIFAI